MPKVYNSGEVRPLKKFCQNCGSDESFIDHKKIIRLSERSYAITLKEIISESNIFMLNNDEHSSVDNHKTEVWVDPPEKIYSERKSNVIKARKS